MNRQNKLAERLKELRKARGLTQRDMARQFRLSDVGYGAWERGDTEPSIDNVIRLCQFFGCTADSLIGLAPVPPVPDTRRLDELKRRLNDLSSEIDATARAIDFLAAEARQRGKGCFRRRCRRHPRGGN